MTLPAVPSEITIDDHPTHTYEDSLDQAGHPTHIEMELVRDTLSHNIAESTVEAYERCWRMFTNWCDKKDRIPEPANLAVYLNEAAVSESTLRNTLKAACRELNIPKGDIRDTLSNVISNRQKHQELPLGKGKAQGLTQGDFDKIVECGKIDPVSVALIATMRDGLLRSAEVVEITWADITHQGDGSGRLFIQRSKTDQMGRGAEVYLSRPTMARLAEIRPPGTYGTQKVFPFGTRTVRKRLETAGKRAGLPGQYSGHSCRVGMAQDLAAGGASTTLIQDAGRWKDASMPARYARGGALLHGAVAQYYSRLEEDDQSAEIDGMWNKD